MKKILHIVVIALLPLLLACSKTEEVGRSQLVVEGWIENGGNPVVQGKHLRRHQDRDPYRNS